jgi:hypothetical protein
LQEVVEKIIQDPPQILPPIPAPSPIKLSSPFCICM